MLKALEINGFKSFADKTRFDFPPGITVVVGPNGSGKSNVVDAIKWVLGEQSAKSLRGKDMSDVIFKGAGSENGRRAANSAEATIVLDNSEGRLDNDSEEVHITRRVYRSGEGEYLINGNACRLKDIKDLFRGTGIGTDAYSLIEQGKVDRLLQASTKDRRAIFEEAAGISRFKAKKIEAQRRLARVDQNLVRLSDIVEEVGSRYRSVKAQASKASRYREYADRLRQLRIELSYKDWQISATRLDAIQTENAELVSSLTTTETELGKIDIELNELQGRINQFSDALLELEGNASSVRESISKLETTIESESKRKAELEERQVMVVAQQAELKNRLEILSNDREAATSELEIAEERFESQKVALAEVLEQLTLCADELAESNSKNDEFATKQSELETNWADQQRRSFELETEINSIAKSLEKLQLQIDEIAAQTQTIAIKLSEVSAAEKKLADETAAKDVALADARKQLTATRESLAEFSQELQDLKTEKNGVAQRSKIIEELEKRQEGVQSGAKNVMSRAKSEPNGPFGSVHGLVADLIQVHVQHAPLIDSILGDWTQFVVCDGGVLREWLINNEPDIAGRVGFYCLDDLPKLGAAHHQDLSGIAGVVGRADQVVTVAEGFQTLVDYLLGNVWIVRTIQDAFRLKSERSSQVRYVTLQSELVEPDGCVVMGPTGIELSLISRRSELRSLKRQLIELESRIESVTANVKELAAAVKNQEAECETLLHEHTIVSQQLSKHQLERENLEQQVAKLTADRSQASNEIDDWQNKTNHREELFATLASDMERDDALLQRLIANRSNLNESIEKLVARETDLEDQRNQLNLSQAADAKTVEGLEKTLVQLKASIDEATSHQAQSTTEENANVERIAESESMISAAQDELEVKLSERDELTKKIVDHADERKSVVSRRDELQVSVHSLNSDLKKWQTRKHAIDLEGGQLANTQMTISERLRDDYGLEIRELVEEKIDFVVEDRDSADQEVESLRRKITSIGAVNTDALKELEDLEDRYNSLDNQFQDLVKAKDSLERIIVRINTDSRKIFVETLEAIRSNFQTLYRRNFGGGKADIVLEEGVDELEAGIDIVATPPGKAEFSNSLLSGGEKALTAVSLLLAIFEFRPSPFCVLDEVDAPFDEANIGRFVEVLKGFLGWTRFVVVTHSKKTMTAADTLYGVTMLGSGISTKVSVRFEDVDEKGNISNAAVRASEASSSEQPRIESTSANETSDANVDDKGVA